MRPAGLPDDGGALDGLGVEPKLLSYEGPLGVGYAVATFTVTGKDDARRFAEQCEALERERLAQRKAEEDPWVRLARLSLETYIRTGKRLNALPENLPSELTGQAAGAFVSLHLSRFFPRYKVTDKPPTPPDTVYALADEARNYLK